MTTPDSDPICDLQSIAAVKQQLFRRWLRPFASMIFKSLLIAISAGLGLYWLLSWVSPHASGPSLRAWIVGSSIAALLICALPVGRMFWLDFKIHRKLSEMGRRVAAGEPVRASELRL